MEKIIIVLIVTNIIMAVSFIIDGFLTFKRLEKFNETLKEFENDSYENHKKLVQISNEAYEHLAYKYYENFIDALKTVKN